ncbi:MAG: alpha-ketoglutarate-dependent taurine dioxygenase [Candidatus Poriferisodalaceae bacterium]|jgi:alpha-ketoglutarate-dependent taurine dioxygenase
MREMTITPIDGKTIGATVSGVELRRLSDDDFATLHAAFLKHGFLLFPGQHLNEEENTEFGQRFGELEFGGAAISNQRTQDGSIRDLNSQLMRTNVGNETWHTDSTYKPISSKCAMLTAAVVPEEGGQTELADSKSAYDALDDATKARIENLAAFHSTNYSQANDLGDFPELNGEGLYGTVYHGEAYLRPLVKVHSETGAKNIFVGRHAFGIPGLERDESRALIKSLIDFIVADESRVYQHNWTPGDTLLWDNRYVLHRARPYDYSKPRHLIATRVAGDEATELAYYPDDPAAEAGRQALIKELEILRSEVSDRRYGATTAAS